MYIFKKSIISIPQMYLEKLNDEVPVMSQERRIGLSPKSRKRAEDVLRTAREMFSSQGYEKTTTLEIAQKLGISEATVFTYFGSKRDLCMQVITDWYGEMSAELETEVVHVHGTRATLGHIVQKHLNVVIRDGRGLCALVLTEGRSPETAFAGLLTKLQRRYTAPLMALLSTAQASGEIRNDITLRLMRSMVYGSMEHVLWDCIISHRVPDLEATARQVTEMLWNAFTPQDVDRRALLMLKGDVEDAMQRFKTTTIQTHSALSSDPKPLERRSADDNLLRGKFTKAP